MHRWPIVFLCLCAGSAVMAEQTRVFEWRDAAGHLSYSNVAPAPGTKGVTSREIETRSFTPAQRVAIEAQLARLEASAQAASRELRARIDAADVAIDAALRRLHRAEDALRAGRQPRASDRIGTADGYSRLRVEYFNRQQQLEDAVEAAQAALAQAYRVRRAIMQ